LALFTGMAVILDNLAISHAVTSYDGKLVIAPLSDRAVMPDPAVYTDCLQEAFTELKSAAIAGSGKKPASRKKTSRQQASGRAKTAARKRSTRNRTAGRNASR